MNADEILFELITKRTDAERDAFLADACAGDADLRLRVEGLWRAHEEAGNFLERPALDGVRGFLDAAASDTGMSAGDSIGPYRLVEKIGEGGMGVVWLATQERPIRRQVALKVIGAAVASPRLVLRFEAERQALALMDHPNIAKLLDAGAVGSTPYFAMELVRGVAITRYCDENRLTPRDRLELFVRVCEAVQHAHEAGVVHRDLKPSNILIALCDGKPLPKVIDFGVAKAVGTRLTEQSLHTEVGQVLGTIEYMSPEQAQLDSADVDASSDVYSLGVVLYELLTGTTPLEGERLRGVAFLDRFRLVRDEPCERPSGRVSAKKDSSVAERRGLAHMGLRGALRGDLDCIVMKCLEKDRRRRYPTAAALAEDLRRHLSNRPVSAQSPRWIHLRELARRRPLVATTWCLSSVLALAGLGLAAGALGESAESASSGESPATPAPIAAVDFHGSLVWARRAGNEGTQARDVSTFGDGSSIVVGAFKGAEAFGDGHTGGGKPDGGEGLSDFAARFRPDGSLDWTRVVAAGGAEIETSVATFDDGGFVVAGTLRGSAVFGRGVPGATTLESQGPTDCFVSRFRADGALEWARRAGGSGDDAANRVASLADGSCVVVGGFSGSSVFGAGERNATQLDAAGGCDVFVAKYARDGDLIWAKRAGGAGVDRARGVSVCPDGSIAVVGAFSGSAAFATEDRGASMLQSTGKQDVLVLLYRSDGTVAWARRAGGTGPDEAVDVAASRDGAVLVVGWFYGSATFGTDEHADETLVSAGASDAFVACYGADGQLRWTRRAGGVAQDEAYGVAVLPDASAVITGMYHGAALWGVGEGRETKLEASTSRGEVFIARYAPEGSIIWARRERGGQSYGRGVATACDGSVVVCGYALTSTSFGDGESGAVVLAPGLFVARYDVDPPTK